MAAYLIADVEITDQAGFEEYRKVVPRTIEKYGGRFLVRGGKFEVLEGEWSPKRVVVLQKAAQAQIVRKCHGQAQIARRIYEEIERRVITLKELLRQEEQTLAKSQRRVSEAEAELARCHQMLDEVQAGLEKVRAEVARLAGP